MTPPTARARIEVPTAGVLPWRRRDGRLEVALVHRARYDDWSWPKGKLDGHETWPGAAVREAREETGLRMRLGIPLAESRYPLHTRDHGGLEKVVHYWAARPVGGNGRLRHEVDRVRWLSVKQARGRLTYRRDLDQLDGLVEAGEDHSLEAWPFAVVRHGHAVARKAWSRKDWLRPLDDTGRDQARDLVDVLGAYGIRDLTTSSATRCIHTIAPYAKAERLTVRSTAWLSEEGYEEKPGRARATIDAALDAGRPALVCSHGPVLPALVERLIDHCPKGAHRALLREAADDHLVKGEALIVHIRGRGKKARVVGAERHLPVA